VGKDVTDWLREGRKIEDMPVISRTARNGSAPTLEVYEHLPEGFIREYVDYADKLSEAPRVFHIAVGLAIAAATLGRRVYLPAYGSRIYPTIWILLVATSSVMRKSTAVSLGRDILELACEERSENSSVLPDEWTPPILYQRLQNEPSQTIVSREFGALLKYLTQSYMRGARETMTDLFDGRRKWEREIKGEKNATESEKKITLEWPQLNLIAASNIDWFINSLRGDELGGFAQRFLYFPQYETDKIMPRPPGADYTKMKELAGLLNELRDFGGMEPGREKNWNAQSGAIYDNWYVEQRQELKQVDPKFHGFEIRLNDYCIKVALVFQASIDPSPASVSVKAIEMAIAFMDEIKRMTRHFLNEEFVFDADSKDQKRAMGVIYKKPGLTMRDFKRATHWPSKKADTITYDLEQQGRLEKREGDRKDSVCLWPPMEVVK